MIFFMTYKPNENMALQAVKKNDHFHFFEKCKLQMKDASDIPYAEPINPRISLKA